MTDGMNSRPFIETLGGSGEYISAPVQGKLRQSETLDVLGLLRKYEHADKLKKQAADEIELLRRMAQTMAGFISTTTEWLNCHPEDVYHAFYDKAARGE